MLLGFMAGVVALEYCVTFVKSSQFFSLDSFRQAL